MSFANMAALFMNTSWMSTFQPHFFSCFESDKRTDSSNRWFFQRQPLPEVNIELKHRDLWMKFSKENTEMIITKSGRRMFPTIQANVSGLREYEKYCVLLEIVKVSDRRYKYCGYENSGNKNGNVSGWSFAGPAEPQHPFHRRIYVHPESPSTGEHWMNNSISFSKLKLTNNINDNNSNIVLTSMHKYVPKIWIVRCEQTNLNTLLSSPSATFVFKETEFIAVTAYQNDNITKLKIDHNPFAKGFRETGQSRFKRKYQQAFQADVLTDDSNRTDDEMNNKSYDSDSSQVTNESNANILENLRSPIRHVLENNTNDVSNTERPLVPVDANRNGNQEPPSRTDNENQVSFHRPWLLPESRLPTLPSLRSSTPRPSKLPISLPPKSLNQVTSSGPMLSSLSLLPTKPPFGNLYSHMYSPMYTPIGAAECLPKFQEYHYQEYLRQQYYTQFQYQRSNYFL
ncbi:T-box protein 2-like [Pogonomyrmex barbatus]|uniref:T-box protein 2-like n=1 Tax=Pogonomyrmex barbatus TaxID=144034 RepID=A0A6I9WSX7_9HYME|nr:T-box protein 2-like [Pogonomyrmex barbatus]